MHCGNLDPLIDINGIPLIDVMLVLLVMFIITIPAQTHSVKLDLPQAARSVVQMNKSLNELSRTAANPIL